MRLRPKITLAMFVLTLLVSGMIAGFLYRFIERQLRTDVRERLHDVAHIGSHTIDLAAYQRLAGKLGELDAATVATVESSADYRAISHQLHVIRAADPSLIRFVYLLAPTDDPASPRFVVDADVIGGKPAARISHFGQRYDAARIPGLVGALRDCAAAHEGDFVYDEEFQVDSVSAYVPLTDDADRPLHDASGRCLGVLGVDVTVHEVDAALVATTRLEIVVSIAGVVLALVISLLLGHAVTRSVLALHAIVRRFADKDFAARTPALPQDEIGELGKRFDAMADVIQLHNDHLEQLVTLRTNQLMSEQGVRAQRDAQLAEAHAEVRDVRTGDGRYSGRVLDGFALGPVIGRGAMGEVYEAADRSGRPVAVKVLAPQFLADDDSLRRFQREARAIAAVDTPHIVRLIEVGPADAPIPYLVMERLTGSDLNVQLKERPVFALAEVVAIVDQVATGLAVAHAAGVVHRDLKPANLFAAERGGVVIWKILDFGVSKIHGEATLTAAQIIGTPSYMAPEQARGEAVDERIDIYALGVIAYRLLTGRPAVTPKDPPAMLVDVVFRMPQRPSELVPLTPAVEAVLAIALAKRPDDRFATVRELADALRAAAEGDAPELVERAAAILARAPWGGWVDGAPRGSELGSAVTIPDRR